MVKGPEGDSARTYRCGEYLHLIRYTSTADGILQRGKRIYMLDRHNMNQQEVGLEELGAWMRRRDRMIDRRLGETQGELASLGIDREVLESEWKAQRVAQLSVQNRTSNKA